MNSRIETAIVLFTDSANTASSMTTDKETLKLARFQKMCTAEQVFSAALNASIKQIESAEKNFKRRKQKPHHLLSDGDDKRLCKQAKSLPIQMCNDKYIEVYTVGFGSANDTTSKILLIKQAATRH